MPNVMHLELVVESGVVLLRNAIGNSDDVQRFRLCSGDVVSRSFD